MDLIYYLRNAFADGRLAANLVAVHGLITITVLVSLLLRHLMVRGSHRLKGWTGLHWLEEASEEASRHARKVLFWLTATTVLVTLAAGTTYHLASRDIRNDARAWYDLLTPAELMKLALDLTGLLAVLVTAWFAVRIVRRIRSPLENQVNALLGNHDNETSLRRWFGLLFGYGAFVIRLAALWGVCTIVGLGNSGSTVVGFLLRVSTILVVARLLTLSCWVVTHTVADLGERHLRNGPFRHYWERITRLFPFGERCFEAAVYVTAASLCVRELHFIAAVADFGPKIVRCIGIFFVTRVLIELLQVLLGEAFGLYAEEETIDQKRQTLVPLLYSISQYVLYFGSTLVMLGVLGVDTTPILAGAGILGLAVGLGAQSLVTDIVSGFFILFENQYLVGDCVQIGDALGIVEAVGIRVTQIRDGQGKLYIIPNGQIKAVVSYSKGYVNAVVDVRVPSGSDLETVFRRMTEAGKRLRQAHHDVLADTQILGLVELGTSEMTVRAVTKVRPGSHSRMQNEYRRQLKIIFDENATGKPTSVAA